MSTHLKSLLKLKLLFVLTSCSHVENDSALGWLAGWMLVTVFGTSWCSLIRRSLIHRSVTYTCKSACLRLLCSLIRIWLGGVRQQDGQDCVCFSWVSSLITFLRNASNFTTYFVWWRSPSVLPYFCNYSFCSLAATRTEGVKACPTCVTLLPRHASSTHTPSLHVALQPGWACEDQQTDDAARKGENVKSKQKRRKDIHIEKKW